MRFDAIKLCPNESGYADSLRKSPFWIIKVVFRQDSPFDKSVLRNISAQAEVLGGSVNAKSANNSQLKRSKDRLLSNAIAGLLSEYCWKNAINLLSTHTTVAETSYEQSKDQIDLITTQRNLKIEIRSSFPRNGVEFALFHPKYRFDILGPYSNAYKPGEVIKDFYLRALYHVAGYEDFLRKFNTSEFFNVYLTGGASHEMMVDPQISVSKSLIPEDSLIEVESSYSVIPYEYALDTIEIIKAIRDED